MNNSLGNTICRLILLIVSPLFLFADVKLKAPNEFYKGDQVVFTITASGKDVKFPEITKIGDLLVQNAGVSSNTSIINGKRSQSITKSFAIRPQENITIPSFKIEIDGKMEKTQEKTIVAKTVNKTVSKNYSLDIRTDKKDIYVGEQVKFTINFKYHKELKIVDLKFHQPNFSNFWVKELKRVDNQKQKGEYVEQELNYLLFPQKSGKLNIEPLKIDIITPDDKYSRSYGFFSNMTTKSTPVYSNKLQLNVKPLPSNVNLTGDFEISSTIDKDIIEQNGAVSYKVTIKGRGNLDDIDDRVLDIPNAVIYDNPSKKQFDLLGDLYGGVYTKTYSIVSSRDFTIPSISLSFFDKDSKSVKTVQTKEYHIKVKGEAKKEVKLQTIQNDTSNKEDQKDIKGVIKVVETTDNQKIVFFILGFIAALILVMLYWLVKNKRSSNIETPLETQIKKVKSKEQLLKLIVVYINIDNHLDKIIFDLENKKEAIDIKQIKKQILSILKDKKLEQNTK